MSHAALRGRAPAPRPSAPVARSHSARPVRGPAPPRAFFGDLADAAAATGLPTAVAGLSALAAVGVGILVTDPERR